MIYAVILFVIITIFIHYNKKYETMDNHYLDGIDVVYWINLDRSTDRRKNMTELLQDDAFQGIPNERVAAIDGKNDRDAIFKQLDIPENSHDKSSNTEYATLLSHLNTIRRFNDSDYDVALILEDDVTLDYKKYWKKTIKEIIHEAPTDWEIIMVGYNYGNLEPVPELKDWSYNSNEYITQHAWGAYSYLINKKAANKISSSYKSNKYKLSDKATHTSDTYLYAILKTYVYKYPLFTYRTKNDSLIHPWDIEGHVKSKKYIIEQYESIQ